VEEGQPKCHFGKGWEPFTDAILRSVAGKDSPVVFMLWGEPAKAKAPMIRQADGAARHCILETSHPSGLSAWRGFRACGHFSAANAFLGEDAIDWALPAAP
jgi:uracil-DNA glycosylase